MKEQRIWKTKNEIETDFKAIPDFKVRTLFKCVFYCGLRVSEVLRLQIKDIDLKKNYLYVWNSKRGKNRIVPIPETLNYDLRLYLKTAYIPQDMPFFGYTNRSWIFKMAKRYFGITTHGLRHSYLSHLHNQGVDLKTIRDIAGHTDIRTTQIYAHTTEETKAKAVQEAFK